MSKRESSFGRGGDRGGADSVDSKDTFIDSGAPTAVAPGERAADEGEGTDRGSGARTERAAVLTQRDRDSTILQRHSALSKFAVSL